MHLVNIRAERENRKNSTMSNDLSLLEEKIGYKFKNIKLLQEAMTHASYSHESSPRVASNQRLEFLGDAILSHIITLKLFTEFPEIREGLLTIMRASLVNEKCLTKLAAVLHLEDYIRLGKGQWTVPDSVLADAFEALVGAMYLDAGLENTQKIVSRIYGDWKSMIQTPREIENPKGVLLERVQDKWRTNNKITYVESETSGENGVFECTVFIDDRHPLGTGQGRSKKEATANAALNSLKIFEERKEESGCA